MLDSVLVIDSSEEHATPITGLLRDNGYDFEVLTDVANLLPTLKAVKSLVIINDPANEILEKEDYLGKIRAAHPRLPVIVITDQQDPTYLVKIANLGVSLVLESTIDTDSFLKKIDEYVSHSTGDGQQQTSAENQKEKPATIKTTAPKTKYLSTYSPGSREMVQKLWSAFQSGNNIFVVGPEGVELELMAQELSEWSNITGRRTLSIEAEQLTTPETKQTLDQLSTQETFSNVILVNDLGDAPTSIYKALNNFIKVGYQKITQGTSLTYVYHVTPEGFEKLPQELREAMEHAKVIIEGLSDRLADLAYYLQKELNKRAEEENWDIRPKWSPESIAVLSEHSWSNNYQELISFVRRVGALEDKRLISGVIASELLGAKTDGKSKPKKMSAFLMQKQKRFIGEKSEQSGKATEEVLKDLELSPDASVEEPLFPEILNGSAAEGSMATA